MTIENFHRLSLTIVAIMMFVMGSLHGVWHWFFPGYPEMEGLTKIQWDLNNIFSWSIGLFNVSMGILTFIIARAKSVTLNQLRVFSAWLVVFWVCRLVLEFFFPVKIPFIVIPNTSLLLKILILIGLSILALPEFVNISKSGHEKQEK